MPGRLIAQINASLDGYIEDEKHDIDWHFVDDEYEEFINETLRSLDGMIFGRKAYEPLSAYWPTAAANPDASVRRLEAATLMHEIPKYVVSTTLSGSDWNNTDVISGDVRTAVQDLKAASSRDIAVFAGGAGDLLHDRLRPRGRVPDHREPDPARRRYTFVQRSNGATAIDAGDHAHFPIRGDRLDLPAHTCEPGQRSRGD